MRAPRAAHPPGPELTARHLCASQETYKLPHRLIEKKRRDRINECIAQLKDLLPEHLKLTVSPQLEPLQPRRSAPGQRGSLAACRPRGELQTRAGSPQPVGVGGEWGSRPRAPQTGQAPSKSPTAGRTPGGHTF